MQIFHRKSHNLFVVRYGAAAMLIIASAWAFAQINIIEKEGQKKLPDDSLNFINQSSDGLNGYLLYQASVRVPSERVRQRFLIVRQTGSPDKLFPSNIIYRVQVPAEIPDLVFDPEFSPTGKEILFKAGWPYDQSGLYRAYLWNIKTKELRLGPPEELTHRRISLSHDGDYLAYNRGGDSKGDDLGRNRTAPLKLLIYDLKAKKSHAVIENPAVKFVAWTWQGTLLYSVIDEDAWLKNKQPEVATRPNIYEVPATGGEAKLILKDGYRPSPSADGKWIACITSTNPEDTVDKKVSLNQFHLDLPRRSFVCLYNRSENKRIIVQAARDSFPDLLWTPDSKRLIVLSQKYRINVGEAYVNVIEVETLSKKAITTLKATDSTPVSWGGLELQFQPLTISNDGNFLVLRISEVKAREKNETFLNAMNTVQTVDLRNGKVTTLAKIYNWQSSSLGLDWREYILKN